MGKGSKKFVPIYNLNVPNGGPQKSVKISPKTPVHSTYTGNVVGYGRIPKGTISDAPVGHPNHGKPFHVVEHNPVNKSYMIHHVGNTDKR